MKNNYEQIGKDFYYKGISSLELSYNKFMENFKKKTISEKEEKEDILSTVVEYCLNNNVDTLQGELSEDIYEKLSKLSSFNTPSTEKFRVNYDADGYTTIRYKDVVIAIYKRKFVILNPLEFD